MIFNYVWCSLKLDCVCISINSQLTLTNVKYETTQIYLIIIHPERVKNGDNRIFYLRLRIVS